MVALGQRAAASKVVDTNDALSLSEKTEGIAAGTMHISALRAVEYTLLENQPYKPKQSQTAKGVVHFVTAFAYVLFLHCLM